MNVIRAVSLSGCCNNRSEAIKGFFFRGKIVVSWWKAIVTCSCRPASFSSCYPPVRTETVAWHPEIFQRRGVQFHRFQQRRRQQHHLAFWARVLIHFFILFIWFLKTLPFPHFFPPLYVAAYKRHLTSTPRRPTCMFKKKIPFPFKRQRFSGKKLTCLDVFNFQYVFNIATSLKEKLASSRF